jgi:hypothetical protein
MLGRQTSVKRNSTDAEDPVFQVKLLLWSRLLNSTIALPIVVSCCWYREAYVMRNSDLKSHRAHCVCQGGGVSPL